MVKEKSCPIPIKIVASLPDLIQPEDYRNCNEEKKIRLRISINENGVEILGDSLYVEPLEKLLASSGARLLERSLCG
ncbi:MAG: radical SAM-modified peptide, FtsH ternary system-associated [Pseudomonadota bacterium]|nr:radical SAM-modified peptide, FtsH ternary system-associated [Pseudomonadota bacterium]